VHELADVVDRSDGRPRRPCRIGVEGVGYFRLLPFREQLVTVLFVTTTGYGRILLGLDVGAYQLGALLHHLEGEQEK
jgi:hypothetical protein